MLNRRSVVTAYSMLLLLFSTQILGQTKQFQLRHYNHRDGLPGHLVLDVSQDASDLIWMATENGLVRFDGYEFVPFNNFKYSREIQGSEFNISVTENQRGELAILHGQKSLNFELFNLQTLTSKQIEFSQFSNPPVAIYTKKKGATFLAFKSAAEIVITRLEENQLLTELFSLDLLTDSANLPITLFVDQANNFWICQPNNLSLFDEKGQLIKRFSSNELTENGIDLEVVFIYQDQKTRIWLALKNEKGLYQYKEKAAIFQKEALGGNADYIANVWEDAKGNLLFKGAEHRPSAYISDLICLQPNGQLTSFAYLKSALRSITSIYGKDFFDMLLIGAPNGLSIVNQNPSNFKNLLNKELQPGDWGRSIRGITGDGKGTIYIGTETNELFQYNTLKDSLFELPLKNIYARKGRKYFGGRQIFLDQENHIWSLSSDSETATYLHKFDLKTQKTTTQKMDGMVSNFVFDGAQLFYFVIYDKIGGNGRLVTFDLKNQGFTNWTDREGLNPILGTRARSILGIKKGILWIGTTKGLLKINLEKRQSKLIELQNEQRQLIGNQEIIAISAIEDGLWLGTSNGFSFFDIKKEKVLASFNEEDGLVNNSVCGILSDKKGNLWLSTFDGLSFFDRTTKQFTNFYEADGLSYYEFNRMAFYQDENDTYFFGGMNGVNTFDADKLLKAGTDNQLVLTKFVKSYADSDTQSIQIANLENLGDVILAPNYAQFEFNFSMSNYVAKEIRYSAWLENYEKDWRFLGDNPRVQYSKIPPGNYTLHIKAVDAKGNAAKNQLAIPIFVQEVFYKKAWFQLLMVSLALLLVWGIGQYHAAQRLKVERLRTKLSSDLHDEVSGLLAGIAMQTDLMQLSISDENYKSKLAKIGTTSRSAMSRMGDVLWSVDARKDKLEDLLLRMQEHTAEVLQPLGIDYQFEIGKFNVNKKIGLKLRQNLYLIFKESINNIAKHSTASKATISIENKGNFFQLRIKDNGEAKDKSASYKTGQGLSNLKMRSEEIQGNLSTYSKNGFEVVLKVRRFA